MSDEHTTVQLYDESTRRLITFDIPEAIESLAERLRDAHESTFLGEPIFGEAGAVGFGQTQEDRIVLWFFQGYPDVAQQWIEHLEKEELALA